MPLTFNGGRLKIKRHFNDVPGQSMDPLRNQKLTEKLFKATRSGNHAQIRKALSQGALIDGPEAVSGRLPLVSAVNLQEARTLRLLLDLGADIDALDAFKHSAVHEAARHGRVECLKLLLERGANARTANVDGYSPAMGAAAEGHVECLVLLADHGADLDGKDLWGRSVIHLALTGRVEALLVLAERGVDLNTADSRGDTVLMMAAQKGYAEETRALASWGADLNQLTKKGWSAAMGAAFVGQLETLAILAQAGADLSLVDQEGRDARAWALAAGQHQCAGFIESEIARRALESSTPGADAPKALASRRATL
jgi:ankyrin repeat protein